MNRQKRPRQRFRSSRREDRLNPIYINQSIAAATGKNEWGGGRRKYTDGKDNEPVGVMDKTCRRNFASLAHLKERVLRSSLCFMGTRRLTGFAPAPSHPSKPPIKKEKSCFLSEGYTGREGRMGGKGRNTLQDGSQQKVTEDKLQLTSRSGQGATALLPFPAQISRTPSAALLLPAGI